MNLLNNLLLENGVEEVIVVIQIVLNLVVARRNFQNVAFLKVVFPSPKDAEVET